MTEPVTDPRNAKTFPQMIRATAAAYGDDIAITLQGETIASESITFRGIDRQSSELGRGLLARGAGKGSRIGFILGNGPGFAVALAAITRIGAVAIPISTMIRSNELVRVLRQSDISFLIVQRNLLSNDYVDRLLDALPALRDSTAGNLRLAEVPYLRCIVSTGQGLPAAVQDVSYLTDAAASISEALLEEIESEVHPMDQAVEIYTSGSMALPKGVKHLHGALMRRTAYFAEMAETKRGDQTPTSPSPMFWVGGMGLFLLPYWMVGGTSNCLDKTVSNSRLAMGSVLQPEDLKLLGQSKPFWGLGMSESFGPYSWGDELRAEGYPLSTPLDHVADGFELRVVNEDGTQTADGEIGEIQVRGYGLAPALHKLHREDYYTLDGFYHTGDRGLVQGSRVIFVGRDGDMIKAAGSNVSPAEVELEMQAWPGVESAFVVGLPDKERGQLVVAAVIARAGATLDLKEMQSALRGRLSPYKVPREIVEITREELPVLHSNKVSRRLLETMLIKKLGREG